MPDKHVACGVIQDPIVGHHLSYEATCTRIGNGWSCIVEFDDGQWKFGLEEPIVFHGPSFVLDVVARMALQAYQDWK